MKNRFEALAGDEDDDNPLDDPEDEGESGPPPFVYRDDEGDGREEKTIFVVRRWSRNASQRKCESSSATLKLEPNHSAALCSRKGHGGGLCPGYSQAPEVSASGDPSATASGAGGETACLGLFQEMHQDCLNGCDEKIEEWEEIEFLVDSGASATVVNTNQVKAVKAVLVHFLEQAQTCGFTLESGSGTRRIPRC